MPVTSHHDLFVFAC